MTRQDKVRRTIRLLQESTQALRQTIILRRKLNEFRLLKPDNTRVTPSDLYYAVNEMAAGYGGPIGAALRQASQALYQAHTAFVQQQEQGQQQTQPTATAASTTAAPAPAAPAAAPAA